MTWHDLYLANFVLGLIMLNPMKLQERHVICHIMKLDLTRLRNLRSLMKLSVCEPSSEKIGYHLSVMNITT